MSSENASLEEQRINISAKGTGILKLKMANTSLCEYNDQEESNNLPPSLAM